MHVIVHHENPKARATKMRPTKLEKALYFLKKRLRPIEKILLRPVRIVGMDEKF